MIKGGPLSHGGDDDLLNNIDGINAAVSMVANKRMTHSS
jgi:hypothetical protein